MQTVARVGKLFGVDGQVTINLYTTFPEDFDISTPLFAKVDNLMVPLFCDSFERRGRASALVSFADINTERRVTEFLGKELSMTDVEDEDANDEFYMEDLIGFKVEVDDLRGTLSDYYHSEQNPLFGLTFEGREVLVPAVEEFILAIDFERQIIKFSLPEGLLEL